MSPTNRADRERDATTLLSLLPSLDARLQGKVMAWIDESWDVRDGEPSVPKSDTVFHGTRADALLDASCALDALILGEPTKDRVRLQREARQAGYKKPWGRGAGY